MAFTSMCKHLWRDTESLCTSDDGDDDDPFQEDFFKIVQTPMERSRDAKELSESLSDPGR